MKLLAITQLMTSNNSISTEQTGADDANASSASNLPQKTVNTTVIREVYDGINSQERFMFELETALADRSDYIVIEPNRLGETTSQWIRIGNWLHKGAVLSGASAIILPQVGIHFPRQARIPLSIFSIGCASLYAMSWQFDPCCKYQVTADSGELSQLNMNNLTNASPVVLVRRDDTVRKNLHNIIAILAACVVFQSIRSSLSS